MISIYRKEEANIDDSVLLIRINKYYHYGITDRELYDATRGVWKIGENRDNARYAFAVYGGLVREVYKIREWLPAGTTFSTRGDLTDDARWEFVGEVAEEKIREKYLLKSVEKYLPNHAQNPIRYVNYSPMNWRACVSPALEVCSSAKSRATMGILTDTRAAMFVAAIASAGPEKPQQTQLK